LHFYDVGIVEKNKEKGKGFNDTVNLIKKLFTFK